MSLHADMEEDNSQDPKKRELLGGEARDIPDIAEKNVLGFWGKNKKVFRYENKIILDGKTGFICF